MSFVFSTSLSLLNPATTAGFFLLSCPFAIPTIPLSDYDRRGDAFHRRSSMPRYFATSEDNPQPKRGRPSDYSAEISETICHRLLDGESLRNICADAGMPDKATVFRWLARHPDFRARYTIAREVRMDELLYEAVKIADNCALDRASIKCASRRIKARMWQGGRMTPRKYGRG
jgi:Bacteriophage Sf6, terminase small subunit-like